MGTVEKLLMVGIADPDPCIRETVFRQFSKVDTSPALVHYLGEVTVCAPNSNIS